MTDLTRKILQNLKNNQKHGLFDDSDLVWPYYNGFSILNIPGTISKALGAPLPGASLLDEEIASAFGFDIKRVIFLLVDALGLNLFQRWLKNGKAGVWKRLIEGGSLAPLTSISPSTTSAAITSYWTAQPASAHGIAGYELWLKEFGLVANMITQNPFHYYGSQHSLEKIGFEPENFLPVPTLGNHLGAHGIKSVSFQHSHITNSGLSRMFMDGTEQHPFSSTADQWLSLRDYIESDPDQKQYIWTYYPMVDTLSHLHGPDDPRVLAEFQNFSFSFEQQFLNMLSPEARKGTLLLMSADHGQIHTPQKEKFNLVNHPGFLNMLHMKPTGENRLAYLYVKPGKQDAVRNYIAETWPESFYVYASSELVEKGLFGTGEVYSGLIDRIGDLVVVPRGNAYFWWSDKKDPLHGRHGGLHEDEMLVPFLAARLDN